MSRPLTREEVESFGKQEFPYVSPRFNVPPEAGSIGALARFVGDFLSSKGDCRYLVTEWSVWPSGELMPLFDRVRLSNRCESALSVVPGEYLQASEMEYAQCILACGLYFAWTFRFVAADGSLAFSFDDDEYMQVLSSSNEELDEVTKLLEPFNMDVDS